MSDPVPFSYHLAFDRNIGWTTEWEQLALRGKRVAVAGMGGVGGFHLLTLARLGVGAFSIADLDQFELVNFNRQIGANVDTLGRPKAEVLAEMTLAINPTARITRFDAGIDDSNIDAFLAGADLFVDGFDFFVLGIRRKVFARCAELGIPAITAAPLGMGVGYIAFVPGGMSFEEYFRFEGRSEQQQYVRFLAGLSPAGLHRAYIVDPTRVDFANHRAPSTVAGCVLSAGVVAAASVKLLLDRDPIKPAPYHHHFDAYRSKLAVSYLRRGNAGPLQRVKIWAGERFLKSLLRAAPRPAEAEPPATALDEILNLARWTPSGDNSQPWRFQKADEDSIAIRIRDDSQTNVYEYRDAEPTLLSGGMLLESLRIAATGFGREMAWRYDGRTGNEHRVLVEFKPRPDIEPDRLLSFITTRSVDRRPYRMQPLRPEDKVALSEALGPGLSIDWHESRADRWQWARLSAAATDIRLRARETFAIHQRIIDWTLPHSPTGVPAAAIGVNRPTMMLMRWALGSWSRMARLNRITGTGAATLQMDLLPGLSSAGYFVIGRPPKGDTPGDEVRTLLESGMRLQRFWLTAAKLGLVMQPALAILGMSYYGETGAHFTSDEALRRKAEDLALALKRTAGRGTDEILFVGRIGWPHRKLPTYRSTRRPLHELMGV